MAGGRTAREFVKSFGLSDEYAGFETATYDSLLEVAGPPEMPDLHDFQRRAADNVRELLRLGKGRGLLSLPTGAGKTRTAVQALVEALVDGDIVGPILWVAQTEELCEQAVQSWSDNWRALGSRETLKISRLWSSNEVTHLSDSLQVVVATIAKLEVVMANENYRWLADSVALVIDEAHRATTPAYTQLLDWMGMGRNRDRVPVIGLSATPFRGTSEDETRQLVARFGGRRLDDMTGDPYQKLQEMGVLARVDHRLLAGSSIELNPDELHELRSFRRLPPSVLQRIGEDRGRNQMLIDTIAGLDETTTVLLFSTSVDHAELMAALLSTEGIRAQSISARTSRGSRRHYIDQFRKGEIRVLTNYGVLTEGFDAPAVGAVFVARPTYSPNLYQQMIGRGLRGPANGGKERCLIANVEDNLAQFGESLAFREFEHLWGDR
jgi:superfamily II DNA or RNA helicase